MTDVIEVAAFALGYCPEMGINGTDVFLSWLKWHCQQQTLAVIKDDDERIVAIGIANPVMPPNIGPGEECYDPEGSCIYVSLGIATSNLALKGLFLLMRKRFGHRDTIAYRRPPDEKVRILNYDTVCRRILQLKEIHHG